MHNSLDIYVNLYYYINKQVCRVIFYSAVQFNGTGDMADSQTEEIFVNDRGIINEYFKEASFLRNYNDNGIKPFCRLLRQ